MSKPEDESRMVVPAWVWLVYGMLFLLSVPWYLPAGDLLPVIFALPLWVVISLLAVIAIAGFTAFVIQRYWKDAD